MRLLAFASRNRKDLLRDPWNLAFGIGFPIVLLLLLSAIQANIPVSLFTIEKLAPGIAVFSLSFISLFSATLIAEDRTTSFLMRLFASPLSAADFILGYALPLLPMGDPARRSVLRHSLLSGVAGERDVLLALVVLIPPAILFIGIGLLAGSVLTDKQVGAICGALLTNVSAWLSGHGLT